MEKENQNKFYSGIINGHEFVDLGLSVKWATCNVGASSSEDYGKYYAWGEIRTKLTFKTKNSVTNGYSMRDIAGDANYDVARAKWGDTWRLPTIKEFHELIVNCTKEWVNRKGINGMLLTSLTNGNSIFLPAVGFRKSGEEEDNSRGHRKSGWWGSFDKGDRSCYWSSSPESSSMIAWSMNTNSHGIIESNSHGIIESNRWDRRDDFKSRYNRLFFSLGQRYYGLSVRPVSK